MYENSHCRALPLDVFIWTSFRHMTLIRSKYVQFLSPQRDNFVPETIIFIYVAFYTF